MDKITDVEFKQALDQIITAGLNSLDVATVFGQLCITKRFVEVVYDTNVVASLDRMRQQQAIAQEAARQLAAQQTASTPTEPTPV